MNRKERRRLLKLSKKSGRSQNGSFGKHSSEKAWSALKEKKLKTFQRYLKEGRDSQLLKKRKAYLSILKK